MQREGLTAKYRVERLEDRDGKHGDCRYFVLDPQHDPAAAEAVLYYAMRTPNKALSRDLGDWIESLTDRRWRDSTEITGVSYLCRECGDPLSEHADPCHSQ